jgi:hypothetical protein
MAPTPHQAVPLHVQHGKTAAVVNRMGNVGNYCSDRGDGAAEGEEM